jgi:hypothetical protein
MPVVSIVIDGSTSRVITGTYEYDRDNGGTLKMPSGSSLPGTPAAKEVFWNTSDSKIYRRNDADTAWVAVEATAAAHASSHQSGGGDAIKLDDLAAPDDNTDLNATVSAHGLLPKLGGGTTNFLRADGTWAAPPGGISAHDLGGSYHNSDTLANLNAKISDATLDDSSSARTPTSHASSHQSGGGDSIKLDDLGSPDDNTDLNATTGAHGLCPKLGGGTTNYLRADGTWQNPSSGSGGFPTMYKYGFGHYPNATNPNYQIDILTGVCRSDDDTTDFATSSTITVDITASGANGLDTGSEAAWTWYHIYVIYNPTTETYAGLLSISSSSPTMPSGYTKKRRVGCVINNGSSNFKQYRANYHVGREVYHAYDNIDEDDVQLLSAAGATSWTDVYTGASIPLTSLHGYFLLRFSAMNYDQKCFVRPKGDTIDEPVTCVYAGAQTISALATSSLAFEMKTDGDRYVQYKHSSANCELSMWVRGFYDFC